MKKLILGFLLFLISTTAHAEVRWLKQEFFSNSAGLNDAFAPTAVADNEATDLQNVIFTESGSFKTREGYAKLNSSTLGASVVTTGLKYYAQADGDRFLVGVFSDDKVRKMDYAGSSGPDGTWDDITGALSFSIGQDNLASFAVGQDTLIFDDGLSSTPPYKYTGSGDAADLGGSPPNATLVAFHKNMAFAAGNSSAPSTLYFSDLGDIENWTGGISGNVSVETNDGSIIRALVSVYDALYICKDTSIWRLSGDDKDTFQLQKMVSGVGCNSPNAIALIGNDAFLTSSQGDVYIYDGGVNLKLISTKVRGTIADASFSRLAYASTVVYDKDYFISFSDSSSSSNNKILLFDSFNLAWTKFVGINANAIALADNGSGEDMVVFGDYSGFVYKYPSGTTDAGTPIATSYTTKQFRFPEASPTKDWKLLRVFADQQGNYDLTVETRVDFENTGTTENINLLGSGSSLWDTGVFDVATYSAESLITGRIEVNKSGDFFQIEFSQDMYPISIKGYQIFLENIDRI